MSKAKKTDSKVPDTAEVEEEEVGPSPEEVSAALLCLNSNETKIEVL